MSSQIREPIEETEYSIVFMDTHITFTEHGQHKNDWPAHFGPRQAILETPDNKQELWVEHDDHAGYVVVIDGKGFEFVRTIRSTEP